MQLPDNVNYIINQLNQNGYEAFIVGGCIRDIVMGETPKDWDVTTSAFPVQVKKIFKHTYDTGIKHGTVTVVLEKQHYEITTYRIDGEYKDNRRPDTVFFTDNLEQDLKRRDFTMNAIAYHNESGFVDPFGGIKDINKKTVRSVGDPYERFSEDALRMLRAVRFSACLGFRIEPLTWHAIKGNAKLIKNISAERIRDELNKIILSNEPERLSVLLECGLIDYFHPALGAHMRNVFPGTGVRLKFCKNKLKFRWALLMYGLDAQTAANILKFYHFDNNIINTIKHFLHGFNITLTDDFYFVRKRMFEMKPEIFVDLLYLKSVLAQVNGDASMLAKLSSISDKAEQTLKNNDCISLRQMRIDGNILKNLGVEKGVQMGRILNNLLELVLADPEQNKPEILKQLALKMI